MDPILLSGLLGAIGGLTRSSIGLLKAISSKRKIFWHYWILTTVIAAIVGIFTGIIFNFDIRLSLLAGYAGTDLLEGIYKAFRVQKVYIKSK